MKLVVTAALALTLLSSTVAMAQPNGHGRNGPGNTRIAMTSTGTIPGSA